MAARTVIVARSQGRSPQPWATVLVTVAVAVTAIVTVIVIVNVAMEKENA